jgi:putative PIN family toxin of toxin-antitoxin system
MTIPATRAVFDTNVLVSGHFWKGPPYRCLVAVEAGLVSLVLSDSITSELRDKLIDKFHVSPAEADALVAHLEAQAENISVGGRSGWVKQDPDDDKFIDVALTAGVTTIVSGDHHLLDLGNVEGVDIITARQFLGRLPAIPDDADRPTH